MSVKGGSSRACAACKYQRKRCPRDCPLAPHFPADKAKMFLNVHRLFGVGKVEKMLKRAQSDQKEEMIKSIKYESDMRERFPVHGCVGVICHLNECLQWCRAELQYVRYLIDSVRQQGYQDMSRFKSEVGSVPTTLQHVSLDPTSGHSGGGNMRMNYDQLHFLLREKQGLGNNLSAFEQSVASDEDGTSSFGLYSYDSSIDHRKSGELDDNTIDLNSDGGLLGRPP